MIFHKNIFLVKLIWIKHSTVLNKLTIRRYNKTYHLFLYKLNCLFYYIFVIYIFRAIFFAM